MCHYNSAIQVSIYSTEPRARGRKKGLCPQACCEHCQAWHKCVRFTSLIRNVKCLLPRVPEL